jgi:putative inorganic carbon (HCO3(-)) transporter
MREESQSISLPGPFKGGGLPLALGAAAAGLALLCAVAPWFVALLGTIVILALSVVESEPFLLSVVFLIPVGYFAGSSSSLGGSDARMDLATAARLFVVAGFFLGRLCRGQLSARQMLRPTLTRLSLVLAAVVVASLILAPSGITYSALKALVRLLSYLGFYLFLVRWVDSRERMRRVVFTIFCSTILVAVFGIFQEVVGDYTSFWLFLNPPQDWFLPMEHRPPSFLNYSNSLAGYLNLVLPFALACFALGRGSLRTLGAWTAGLGMVALLCTQSLGGLMAFGCVLVLAIFCFVRDRKQRLLLLVGICTLAIGFHLAREILNPAHQGTDFGYDQATRLVLWSVAWDLFVHSPVTGVGWGNFVDLYGSYVTQFSWIPQGVLAVHNIYLQFLAETGLVGFTAFSLLIFRAIRQAVRQLRCSAAVIDRTLAFGVLGAILSVLLHGIVDFLFQVSPQFGTLFWALLALLVVSARTCSETVLGKQSISLGEA